MNRVVKHSIVSLFILVVGVGVALHLGGLPSVAAVGILPLFGFLVRNAAHSQMFEGLYHAQSIRSQWIAGFVFAILTVVASVAASPALFCIWLLGVIAITALVVARVTSQALDLAITTFVFSRLPNPTSQSESIATVHRGGSHLLGIWIGVQVLAGTVSLAAGLPLIAATFVIMVGHYILFLFRHIIGETIDWTFIRQERVFVWITRALALDTILSISVLKVLPLVHDLGRGFILIQFVAFVIVFAKFFWWLTHPKVSEPIFKMEFIGYIDADDLK